MHRRVVLLVALATLVGGLSAVDHPAPAGAAQADLAGGLGRLWDAAELSACFGAPDLTALKLHVGEPGTKRTFVSPALVAELVRLVSDTGARPFLTDTAVLYKSPRDNAVTHAGVALQHGFGPEAMGAPFLSADGLIGADEVEIRVDGKHFEKVAIATGIAQARSMLLLTHATGHLGTGRVLRRRELLVADPPHVGDQRPFLD